MRLRHLNGLLIFAILLISTAPLYAQREQQNIAKLKADARNVVGTIANDKGKTQAYWQVVDLGRQLEQADNEKDRKRARTLAEKIGQLQKQIGPEFVTLANIVRHVDLNSSDGREIALIIESLNQTCPASYKHRRRNAGASRRSAFDPKRPCAGSMKKIVHSAIGRGQRR